MGEAYEGEMGEGDGAGGKKGVGLVLGFEEGVPRWLRRRRKEAWRQEAHVEPEQRETEEVDHVSVLVSFVAQVKA